MEAFLNSIGYSAWAIHALLGIPILGMALVLAASEDRAKRLALGVSLLELLVSLPIWSAFNAAATTFQFTSSVDWIPEWGISYSVGIDGISVLLILLTTVLTPLALLGSFRYIRTRQRTFYAMMLLLETGVIGVFVALDAFLF
ncbi:MAG: NADH-quinone oxidoreductase subunit M, partial [Gemmatimonadetes bacterium]|nr:NADH-quinone oxidoreductase subunit M [Gemmatimonadota bacterium]